MATVRAFIRTSSTKRKNEPSAAVRFRLCDGRARQLFYTSEIMVDPAAWDAKRECLKSKMMDSIERIKTSRMIANRKNLILDLYDRIADRSNVTSEDLDLLIDKALHPDNYEVEEVIEEKLDFFEAYMKFLDVKDYQPTDKKNFMTMLRLLKRFELYMNAKKPNEFKLDFENFNVDVVRELEYFVRNEYLFINKPIFKLIYEELPEKRRPTLRGSNTVFKIMKRFRTFIKWAIKEQLLQNDPFLGYEMKSPTYGTPYYITIEERTRIAETDLHAAWEKLPDDQQNTINESLIPQLESQRDIFVFHCMIGCRVGDLVQFTPANIINGHISYIARKTRKERVDSIEVPLNQTAMNILVKYWDGHRTTGKLLPFISPQKYNDCIKMIFLLCGITRKVTIWNSTTGREEQHPLNELASSHLARRTFIGNLYKKVQDPNMIGKLSGHVEGSRAFARYRTIDDDLKKSLVNMLE